MLGSTCGDGIFLDGPYAIVVQWVGDGGEAFEGDERLRDDRDVFADRFKPAERQAHAVEWTHHVLDQATLMAAHT